MKNFVCFLTKPGKETEDAFSLVKKEYIKQGYVNPENLDVGFVIPKRAVTFSVKVDGKIAGTISVVLDSEFGLPMDAIYKSELDKLRRKNRKIAEVCRLAVNSDIKHKNLFLLAELFKTAFHYCLYKKIDNICITINPKHDLFYKALSFKKIGNLKNFSAVNNAPAIARTLDVKSFKEKNIKSLLLRNLLFKNPPDYKMFVGAGVP